MVGFRAGEKAQDVPETSCQKEKTSSQRMIGALKRTKTTA